MESIRVNTLRPYDVLIGDGLLSESGARVRALTKARKVALVSDDRVFPLYGGKVKASFEEAGFEVSEFVFPHGEASKSFEVYGQLLNFLCAEHLTRTDLIAALGGGVTGDLAGFAAATYLRGIDYVQLPTTLLAAVDSSVGGKTAIDLPGGKNQAGAFLQPLLVLFDPQVLTTLPEEQYRAGSAEVIKYAMIGNAPFFEELSATPIRDQAEHVVSVCVSMKRDTVEKDEFDHGERMLLNFGHTFGHAAELASDYTLLHGEGVAMGMATITRAAQKRGICVEGTAEKLDALLKQYGLPTEIPYPDDVIAAGVLSDKKRSGNTVRLVLPEEIGHCVIQSMPGEEIPGWIADGKE